MIHCDPDFFIALNKKNPNPSLRIKIITKQKIPKLWIPLRVCQMLFPSSYLDHEGIITIAKRTSKMRLTATAASDFNKPKAYNLRRKRTVLLLPKEIDEENDDKVIVRPDKATEEWDVLKINAKLYDDGEAKKIDFVWGFWLLLAVDVRSVHWNLKWLFLIVKFL